MSNVIDIITNNSPHLSWLKEKTIFLTRYGSIAYNTNIETSDEDFRGVACPPKQYYFGFNHAFEQAELKDPNPDTTIYHIKKFFNLCSACNPNALEILFVDPVDYILVSDIGQQLLDNRDLFLSKRIKHTMCGYSAAQMQRIKLHRRWILNPPKEPPTRKSLDLPEQTLIQQDHYAAVEADISKKLEKYHFGFLEDCPEATRIAIVNAWREMLTELKITTEQQWLSAARQIGLNDNFIEIMQKERAYRNAQKEWQQYLNWKKTRNPERYALEEKFGFDCKFGYHVVRLLRMCRETLTTGKVIVKRPDREELIAIRRGAWSFDQLVEFVEKEDQELQIIYDTTDILPKYPNINVLDKLCCLMIEQSLNKN